MLYCVSIMLLDGQGGQTPVFYNLPVAAAAYLLTAFAVEHDRRDRTGAALTAAVLFGIALQIKYAAVFEAVALSSFGLVTLHLRYQWPLRRLAFLGFGMALLGIAPTALVGIGYALIGHWHDFFFANFLSILAKDSWRQRTDIYVREFTRCTLSAIHLLLPTALFGAALATRRLRFASGERWTLTVLAIWLGATFAGAVLMGKPAEHYFLPTVLPLSLLTAVAFHHLIDLGGIRALRLSPPPWLNSMIAFAVVLGLTTTASFQAAHNTERHWGAPAYIEHAAAVIKGRLHGRCLYVFNRLPVFYYLTDSCLPTRYPFPNHLNDSSELHALPDDALTEFARVLATKPVLLVRIPITQETDPAAEEMLNRALVRDYVLDQTFVGHKQTINLYLPRAAK
jgi:hypothetical protein